MKLWQAIEDSPRSTAAREYHNGTIVVKPATGEGAKWLIKWHAERAERWGGRIGPQDSWNEFASSDAVEQYLDGLELYNEEAWHPVGEDGEWLSA